jgi:uncharacterized protein
MKENLDNICVIYLHGFQSSSRSEKATVFDVFLKEKYPDIDFHAPDLPFSPELVLNEIAALLGSLPDKQVCLLGSSMGGFYAAYLSSLYGLQAVLINPATEPMNLFAGLLGQTVENKHTGEKHLFTQNDFARLRQIEDMQVKHEDLIYCLLETGDEVLDYRLAEAKYRKCHLKVIEGGNHRFMNFENCLSEIMTFFLERK